MVREKIPADDEQQDAPKAPIAGITVTPTTKHILLDTFQPKPGEYHIVSLDPSGNEMPGSDFSSTPRSYEKYYKDEAKFKVKKNPKN